MPGASAGLFECDGCTVDKIYNSFAGPWCYCKEDGRKEQYCTPPTAVPEQLNLQVAAPDVVVASFVTFETEATPEPPVAMFGSDQHHLKPVTGVSHLYQALSTAEHNNYTFHFVRFAGLEPRKTYFYKVKSGNPDGQWSEVFSFRSLYTSGPTRIASYVSDYLLGSKRLLIACFPGRHGT